MYTINPKAMAKISQNQRVTANKPTMGKNREQNLCN